MVFRRGGVVAVTCVVTVHALMSANEQAATALAHNVYRGTHSGTTQDPTGSNINKLIVDPNLAATAETVASASATACSVVPGDLTALYNDYATRGGSVVPARLALNQEELIDTALTGADAAAVWSAARVGFNYATFSAITPANAPYVNLIWASSTVIGCGRAEGCGRAYIACLYGAGAAASTTKASDVYVAGTPCSVGGCTNCQGDLCAASSCGTGCKFCDAGVCELCNSGNVLQAGSCAVCAGGDCASCSSPNAGSCLSCSTTILTAGSCSGSCSVSNCKACNNNICSLCANGYHLDNNCCVADAEFPVIRVSGTSYDADLPSAAFVNGVISYTDEVSTVWYIGSRWYFGPANRTLYYARSNPVSNADVLLATWSLGGMNVRHVATCTDGCLNGAEVCTDAGGTCLATCSPTSSPSSSPTSSPSESPSSSPSRSPSVSPTGSPTTSPTESPSSSPTSASPSASPTSSPSESPAASPTASPSDSPSASPSESPTSESPSASPSDSPSASPSESPSASPSDSPSDSPSASPSESPSSSPSASPSEAPSASPSTSPSASPTGQPTTAPTTAAPTSASPTPAPSRSPTPDPGLPREWKVTVTLNNVNNASALDRPSVAQEFAQLLNVVPERVVVGVSGGSVTITVTSLNEVEATALVDEIKSLNSNTQFRLPSAPSTLGSVVATGPGTPKPTTAPADNTTAIIIGAAVGGAVLLALVGIAVYCCYKRGLLKCCEKKNDPKKGGFANMMQMTHSDNDLMASEDKTLDALGITSPGAGRPTKPRITQIG